LPIPTPPSLGVDEVRCHLVSNVIDLPDFDAQARRAPPTMPRSWSPIVATVCTLADYKRVDRFLAALALARQGMPRLGGLIIGDGPERTRLEALAAERGLVPHGVRFLGRSQAVPALLRHVDIYLLTSQHEGFPNVLLEAMAARLPVVTTPAGDAGRVVEEGVTGYVVPFDGVQEMAQRVLQLANSTLLRRRFGDAGRLRVERSYSYNGLARRLLSTYRAIIQQQRNRGALEALEACVLPLTGASVAENVV
jgi:glycosyltransferase involved in cell wall biosynthesis